MGEVYIIYICIYIYIYIFIYILISRMTTYIYHNDFSHIGNALTIYNYSLFYRISILTDRDHIYASIGNIIYVFIASKMRNWQYSNQNVLIRLAGLF